MAGRHDSGLEALSIRDARLVVVDCVQGMSLQTRERLREAALRSKPILVLSNVDKVFLNLKLEGEEVYQTFSRIIEEANSVIKLHTNELLQDFEVNPREGGSVLFLAATWGFSVLDFAKIYESRYGVDHSTAMKRLWGDSFYDPATKRWTTSSTGSRTCRRGFEIYIYDTIKTVLDTSLQGQKDELRLIMQRFGYNKIDIQSVMGQELFQSVMQIWLPISQIFAEDPTSFNSEGPFVVSRREGETVDVVSNSSKDQKYKGDDMRDAGNGPPQQQVLEYTRKQQVPGKNKPPCFRLRPVGSAKRHFRLPPEVLERLAPYQIEAIRWLWTLYCKSMGGILADDMGMGKTRTVCSYLRGLLHCSLIKRAIVVAPKTVLSQWDLELQRVGLADQINMYRTPSSQGESLHSVITQGGVLLTTYEVFRSKHKLITCDDAKVVEWDYIFLDEGHRIKNDKTQTSNAFSKLKCPHRIVMTGTPFQNTLQELYVLVNFCCPNLLGDEQNFVENFVKPIERAKYADSQPGLKRLSKLASERLKELLKPYMIRRTKNLLQRMGLLGNKHEFTVWLQMTTDQQNMYTALLKDVDLGKSKGASLAEASVAKSICNHPSILEIFDPDDIEAKGLASKYKKQLLELVSFPESFIETSCKMKFILYLVEYLIQKEHKILIFSQSVPMLKLVEGALLELMAPSKVIRMDGSTPQAERDEMIEKFQANIEDPEKINPKKISPDEIPDVFLMTTSVGGMGLNLTAASRVIIIDPSQNPSLDNQSVDRAFRLGQKKEVIVYRLITSGTVEEHTYRQQVLKGEVSTSVIEKKQCTRALEKETGKVLSLPRDGFGMSLTQKELSEYYYTGFEKSIKEHVEFVMAHKLVVGLNNHSLLFSVEESLPWLCEEESPPVYRGRSSRKKVPCDTVIGGEKQSYAVNDERWGVRDKMLSGATADRRLPQNLCRNVVPGGSSGPEAGGVCERPARQMTTSGGSHAGAGRLHEQRTPQMACGTSRPEADRVHEQRAPQMTTGGSSRGEAGRLHEKRAPQMARGTSRPEADRVHEQCAPQMTTGGSSRGEAGRLHEKRAPQMARGTSRPEADRVHEQRAPQMTTGGSSRGEAGRLHEKRASQMDRGSSRPEAVRVQEQRAPHMVVRTFRAPQMVTGGSSRAEARVVPRRRGPQMNQSGDDPLEEPDAPG